MTPHIFKQNDIAQHYFLVKGYFHVIFIIASVTGVGDPLTFVSEHKINTLTETDNIMKII